ncbi:MAG: hypothetical protein JST31_13520, partial [Actinobacteria bacterium]|nr:hypothetical protein [Actinomycetota bacterium]
MEPIRKLAYGALAASVAAALGIGGAGSTPAAAGGFSYQQMAPVGGIVLPGSPYRWQSFTLGRRHRVTVVERVDREGGFVSRRWHLNGNWHLSAPAYDNTGAGLAGDESVLVLSRYDPEPRGLRLRTHLGILDAGPHQLHGPNRLRRVSLPGDDVVYAVSPDGSTVFLAHTLNPPPREPRFTIQPYDLRNDRLLPAKAISGNGEILRGVATTRTQDASGHHVFTLYTQWSGGRRTVRQSRTYLLALDTVAPALRRLELPRLRGWKNPLQLRLHLEAAAGRLTITTAAGRHGDRRGKVIARIPLRRLEAGPP